MNKFVTVFFVISALLVSFTVFMTNPTLHKQIMIVDSDYSFVDEINDVGIVQPKNIEPKKQVKKEIQPQKTQPKSEGTSKVSKPQQVKKVEPKQKTKQDSVLSNPQKDNTDKTVNEVKQAVKEEAKQEIVIQDTQSLEKPQHKSNAVHQLTEQEEIIAWNKWRSDLQNQVMMDTKISAPLGVAFKFSFTVDKFGNLSNVKVWSTTPAYSDMAVQTIKPVLMSYQGKPILNFPQGTKRVITNVAGGFVMSTSTGYSSPSDYSDFERVKR